mmetsp:Transcript_9912/g.18037  ORF Transcript_9912/g.18037 Transcript_9912/m.18037 type:complete len:84 (+) Transcript_9912:3-254(+)
MNGKLLWTSVISLRCIDYHIGSLSLFYIRNSKKFRFTFVLGQNVPNVDAGSNSKLSLCLLVSLNVSLSSRIIPFHQNRELYKM